MAPDPVLVLLGAVGLALIFATAALAKLRSLESFAGVVQNFRILPHPLVRPTALLLPPAELAVAFGLLLAPTRPYAAVAAALLLAVFALAIAVNLRRGRRAIDCGCFGDRLRQTLSWWLVARNGALALLALLAAWPGFPARPLHWLDLVSGIGGGLVLALLHLTAAALLAERAAARPREA